MHAELQMQVWWMLYCCGRDAKDTTKVNAYPPIYVWVKKGTRQVLMMLLILIFYFNPHSVNGTKQYIAPSYARSAAGSKLPTAGDFYGGPETAPYQVLFSRQERERTSWWGEMGNNLI